MPLEPSCWHCPDPPGGFCPTESQSPLYWLAADCHHPRSHCQTNPTKQPVYYETHLNEIMAFTAIKLHVRKKYVCDWFLTGVSGYGPVSMSSPSIRYFAQSKWSSSSAQTPFTLLLRVCSNLKTISHKWNNISPASFTQGLSVKFVFEGQSERKSSSDSML